LSHDWRFTPATTNGSAVASTRNIVVNFPNALPEPLIIYPELHVQAEPNNAASADDGARFYPERARVEGVTGRALVACAARSNRTIECTVEREAPEGFGFGEAAVRILSTGLPADSPARGPHMSFRATVQFDFRAENDGDTASRWERRPLAHDIGAHYPRDQLLAGVDGLVMLGCRIRANRRLNCEVLQEEPGGAGFGAAAVVISREFLLSAAAFGQPGMAENDRITLPIRFVAD
jgi:hypothetical protein